MLHFLILLFIFSGFNASAKDLRVTLFNFENDYNSFWGPVNESFKVNFAKAHKSSDKINFCELKYVQQNDEQFLKEVKATNPDILVMSDDLFYRKLANGIKQDQGLSNIPIVFASLNMKPDSLNKTNSLTRAVIIEYPADKIVSTLRSRFSSIKRMAILRGPFGESLSQDIRSKNIEGLAKIDDYSESVWSNWVNRLDRIEKEYDAVWVLMPYGVLEGQAQVSFEKVAEKLKRFSKPTIGLGQVSTVIERTLTAAIEPRVVGEQLAEILSGDGKRWISYKPSNFIWSTSKQQNIN